MNLTKIDCLRMAGGINRLAIAIAFFNIRRGLTLKQTDILTGNYIRSLGGIPAFNGYNGFPANVCISINNEVVHSIPNDRVAKDGDIVTVDLGTKYGDWMVDSARTEIIGKPSKKEHVQLVEGGRNVLFGGIQKIKVGVDFKTIASEMDAIAEECGVSIISELGGHRIGKTVHEMPFVPMTTYNDNYDTKYRLKLDDVLCFEPIVVLAENSTEIELMHDNWTIKTKDDGVSAHFEHTIIVTEYGCEVLA
jgi:methionyl aminopeptidase